MLTAIREIQTPEKSALLRAYDAILLPLNIVLGTRKLVYIDAKVWKKETRPRDLLLFVISAVATVVFSSLILAVLLLKSRSREHHLHMMQYQVAKSESFLLKNGYRIKDILREEDSFAFLVQQKQSPYWIHYSWDGKLSSDRLFEQRI